MTSTNRFAYIDALKGVLILFVLTNHFLFFSVGLSNSFLKEVFEVSAMPTFFLISGYLFNRKKICNISGLCIQLSKMAMRLLLPTFCCLWLFIVIHNSVPGNTSLSLSIACKDLMWHGYWFTPTLFFICFFSLIFQYFSQKSLFTYFNVYIILLFPLLMHFVWQYLGPQTNYFCIRKVIEYFPFYSLGLVIGNSPDNLTKYLSKDLIMLGLLSLCGIYLIATNIFYMKNFMFFSYARLGFAFLIFGIFMKSQTFWEIECRLIRFICYIGKSSLCIYLLHYFFLPRNMQYLKLFVENNIPLQIVLGGAMSLLLILLVLGTAKILRCCRITSIVFLGEI